VSFEEINSSGILYLTLRDIALEQQAGENVEFESYKDLKIKSVQKRLRTGRG